MFLRTLRALLAAADGSAEAQPKEHLLERVARDVVAAQRALSRASPLALKLLEREIEHRHKLDERGQWLRFIVTLLTLVTVLVVHSQLLSSIGRERDDRPPSPENPGPHR